MASEGSGSQYIPKFIQNVPWYYKLQKPKDEEQKEQLDAFAHQRKLGVGTDLNAAQTSESRLDAVDALDDYDAKRDHWRNNAEEQWDEIVGNWDQNKNKLRKNAYDQNDSDDTDYELEIEELGLDPKHLRSYNLEDKEERSNRDRNNVPAYIMGITANEGGKVRYGQDSLGSIVLQDSEFVRESKDEQDLKKMQEFAWEKNKQHEKEQQMKQYYSEVKGEVDDTLTQTNLDYVVEASPTLLMLKAKEKEKKALAERAAKHKKLMERYG